ncbi:MAG: DUF58 domain-containing protein [Candidatus Methylomirabilia bacterium]
MPHSSEISSAPPPSADGARAEVTAGKLHIRLTATGGVAISLVLAAGIVAVNSGNNLLFLVVASLLAAIALSGLLGHHNLRRVGLRLIAPDEAWAGRPVSVRAELVNGRRRLPAFLLALGEKPGAAADTVLEIPPGGRVEAALTLTFPKRGVQPWPVYALTSEFPFGLIRRGGLVRPPGLCLVYPSPLAVPWEIAEAPEHEGELLSRRGLGVSGDYRGLRDYVPGDSFSRIQWSSWLRLRRLQTKEFEAEGAPTAVYRFDAVPGPGTEERLGQLTWLVRAGLRRGRNVGLVLPGETIPPGSGSIHRRKLLTALARFGETA